ncbi:uncharacterized protein LOC114252983 [Bombyx mandarina]|uniref:HCLS1-associated protein X-1 n=2 Tax=Bombyx TaxID=7090 RepID=A0A8R2AGY1_BOMMO|nr:uncharacterized protein LOC101741342 [Bombyx mori]XP_028043511.1 uncharacterized protein LOC114252983 [Bombyx mandarina]
MANSAFMDKLRSFLGIRQEPPRNDFRNPIWGSDDEDDGDELYSRNEMSAIIDPMDLHRDFTKHMHEMFRSFGSMFGDVQSFFHDENFDFPGISDLPSDEGSNHGNIRDYYLKPGYDNHREALKQDVDLDGKISSNEISGLLKQKDNMQDANQKPLFNGNLVPGRSFCQTIITTSVKKPDGTVETRRIVKNGNEVTEETVTSGPVTNIVNPTMDTMTTSFIYNGVISEVLSSLFRNFY